MWLPAAAPAGAFGDVHDDVAVQVLERFTERCVKVGIIQLGGPAAAGARPHLQHPMKRVRVFDNRVVGDGRTVTVDQVDERSGERPSSGCAGAGNGEGLSGLVVGEAPRVGGQGLGRQLDPAPSVSVARTMRTTTWASSSSRVRVEGQAAESRDRPWLGGDIGRHERGAERFGIEASDDADFDIASAGRAG